MAKKINMLYTDRELRLRLGAEARDKALEYDWKNVCKQWETVIRAQPIYKNLPYVTNWQGKKEEEKVDGAVNVSIL